MKLGIIHFSDIHFRSHGNSISNKEEKLFDSIKNRMTGVEHCILIISGDIAFSGQKEEYEIATKFVDNFAALLKDYCKVDLNIVLTPGNHDCLFKPETESLRSLALEDFSKKGFESIDNKILQVCLEPQQNFFEFAEKYTGFGFKPDINLLFQCFNFELSGKKIRVNAYNTSWFSKLHESPGVMMFPIDHFRDSWEYSNVDFIVSVLHHPLNWLLPEHAREFRNHIEKTSDLVLSGHEHSASRSIYSNLSDNYTYYVEAPTLQESGKNNVSGFNLINIDFSAVKLLLETFNWDSGKYKPEADLVKKTLKRGYNLKSKRFNLREKHKNYLENIGTSFQHHNKEHVELDDLFVYPSLREINPDKKNGRVINSLDIVHLGLPLKRIIIGEDGSGRTILLKRLFQKFFDNGFLPILIPVGKLKHITLEKLKNTIESNFIDQYQESLEELWEFDMSRAIILIDDFHLFPSVSKYKKTFLHNLKLICPNILLSGNKLTQFEEFTSSEVENMYDGFDQYQILEYGPKLRLDLVNNWNTLEERYLEGNNLLRRNDYCMGIVNDIIGKNLIPAYPIYILTILQSIDTFSGQNPEFSLHGYYYQLIINQAIGKAVSNRKEIGAYHNCISNYCYFLFKEEIRLNPLTEGDFRTFYSDFAKRYEITTISYDRMLDTLQKAKLIRVNDGQVIVAYKYVYYYFVAKYLSDHISEEIIVMQIKKMCQRVYREEYANIVIFLIHLEKSQMILSELLSNSRNLFKEYGVMRLDGDVGFINKLVDSIPEQKLIHLNVVEARQQEINEAESYEAVEREFENDELVNEYSLEEDVSELDILSRLNRGIKTIEILGQITKKHWAEIEGDKKFELAEETYLLGLRILKFYFDLLESNISALVDHVRKSLLKKERVKELSIIEIKKASNEFIFNLCALSSYSIVKRVSNAIGLEELSSTFDRIIKVHNHQSVELINLSIKLDFFEGFPENDILDFNKKTKTNYLSTTVLQKLVVDYLHLYFTDYKKKELICRELGIKISEQLMIQSTSEIRKDK
ncbi:MAG: metallophosphoesterase [Imperialibacter sp.]|uniref:metallophosphoesterase n=1 Tax=Imperialibacter sp. TaxID=2038411 RepID=UPI0032EC4026